MSIYDVGRGINQFAGQSVGFVVGEGVRHDEPANGRPARTPPIANVQSTGYNHKLAVERPGACWSGQGRTLFLRKFDSMAEGKIKKLMDKGFGFIDTGTDKDLFFHNSALQGVSFDQLREGQRVSYTPGRGPKGPCAENVEVI